MSSKTQPEQQQDQGRRSTWDRFQAEAEYADSMLKSAQGDQDGTIDALRRSREANPTFAATALALGSVEYQLGNEVEGRKLLLELLEYENEDGELHEVIDLAGDLLIDMEAYADGLVLYRGGVARFPDCRRAAPGPWMLRRPRGPER